MEEVDMPELVESLGSPDDSIRKRAAFRLQSIVGDPSFADTFEAAGGISKLRMLALAATGNTLAYSLASFSRLLELDQGWSDVDQKLIGRLVQLVVSHPLVNILRGAMSILALVVAHPSPKGRASDEELYGFRALKPAIDAFPNFLEMLVSRLSSADNGLCANALQLVNSLMRDSITNDADDEWPKFIKRLQDLGVIKAAYNLMEGTGIQDLAHPLLEFQCLTKILLRKWRETHVDPEKKEHRRALKAVHVASKAGGFTVAAREEKRKRDSRERDPEKWRRLGFDSETPMQEFDSVGFLGIMDLTDFARKSEDGFHKLILEQSGKPATHRCPVAKASLAVTSILYEHFEIDSADADDQQRYMALESRSSFDKVFRPLLLQWSRLHTAGLQAFLRLWTSTGAEVEDFYKIEELVKILIEQVVGLAPRTEDVQKVEQDLANYELQPLRELQMELLEITHEDAWGHHLRQIKEELHHEALQFLKEQRIRCLLAGSWFPNLPTSPYQPPHPASQSTPTQPSTALLNTPYAPTSPLIRPSVDSNFSTIPRTPALLATPTAPQTSASALLPYRFVRLSHNRRYLHYADFDAKPAAAPLLTALQHKVALAAVSSVVSNVSPAEAADDAPPDRTLSNDDRNPAGPARISLTSNRSRNAAPDAKPATAPPAPTTTITILGTPSPATTTGAQDASTPHLPARHPPAPSSFNAKAAPTAHQLRQVSGGSTTSTAASHAGAARAETPLLVLRLAETALAAEWLDGLLMLLNQAPVTAETLRLMRFVGGYGARIRLLGVRFGDAAGGGKGAGVVMPGREGVDEGYFYEIGNEV